MSDRKLKKKRQLGRIWGRFNLIKSRRIILLYHSVGEGPWAISQDVFREQIHWLSNHGRILPLNEMLAGTEVGDLQVSITFDDGYRCLLHQAMPLLNEVGTSATVYLNSGWIGEKEAWASDASLGHYPGEEFLTWDEVRILRDNGWCIGSHGVDHLDLTAESYDVVKPQLVKSKKAIERWIEQPCEHFAYTWGRCNPILKDLVNKSGYHCAVGTIHGPVKKGFDSFAVPRINIDNSYTMEDFAAIVHGDWDYLGWLQKIKNRRL